MTANIRTFLKKKYSCQKPLISSNKFINLQKYPKPHLFRIIIECIDRFHFRKRTIKYYVRKPSVILCSTLCWLQLQLAPTTSHILQPLQLQQSIKAYDYDGLKENSLTFHSALFSNIRHLCGELVAIKRCIKSIFFIISGQFRHMLALCTARLTDDKIWGLRHAGSYTSYGLCLLQSDHLQIDTQNAHLVS